MTRKPEVSLLSSAYRPQNWLAFYDSIGPSDVPFEFVFVGPNEPQFALPENFRFIRTDVKPTQCFEIAFRNSTAEHVMCVADDCEFVTSKPLEKLMKLYRSSNDPKCIVSCRYMMNGFDHSESAHHYFYGDKQSPVMPLSGLSSKKLIEKLGGIDRNFIAVMWDLDLAMRVHQDGGQVVLSDVYLNEDKNRSAGSVLCAEFWNRDRSLLDELWTANGKVLHERKRRVEPFVDRGITNGSQGPRGRWRGRGPKVFEILSDRAVKTAEDIGRFGERVTSILSRNIKRLSSFRKYPEYMKKMIYGKTAAKRKS